MKGYPDYTISENGVITNIKTGTIRKTIHCPYGYITVGLWNKKTKKRITVKVHRLIAQTFIPNPKNKPQINHINGVKDDNRLENLEWCTASENTLHCFRVLKRQLPKQLLTGQERCKPCRVIKGNLIGDYSSIKLAAKANKCPEHWFKRLLHGKKLAVGDKFIVEYIL